MVKKLFLFILFFLGYTFALQPKALLIQPKPTPKNTIITFDLHNVIFDYDYFELVKFIFTAKGIKILYHLARSDVLFKILLLKLTGIKAIDFFIIEITKTNPSLKNFINTLIALENKQLANPETIKIIKELYNKGYELHILSNIGELSYKNLKEKYPEIISYFSQAKVTKLEEPFRTKPSPEAYEDYLKQIGPAKKQIIFIDNSNKNLKAAEAFGIQGILFKSALQLRNKLKELAIL